MKKFLLVLAIGAFAACNNSSSTETKSPDSAAVKPDSSAVKPDSTKHDSTMTAKPDSTKKDSTKAK